MNSSRSDGLPLDVPSFTEAYLKRLAERIPRIDTEKWAFLIPAGVKGKTYSSVSAPALPVLGRNWIQMLSADTSADTASCPTTPKAGAPTEPEL